MIRRKAFRIAAAVIAVPLLIGGGAAAVAGGLQRAEGGYFATSQQRFSTPTAVLKSDEIDVGGETAHPADPDPDVGELARVRVTVRGIDPRVPLFVGIGPKADVDAWLRGTSYDEFAAADLEPFRATFRRVDGGSPAAAPTAQAFWVATSSGEGTRNLEWNKTRGAWSIVVMRLDGQPGLDVSASIGLRFGFLLPVGITGLALGVLLLAVALFPRRRRTGAEAQHVG